MINEKHLVFYNGKSKETLKAVCITGDNIISQKLCLECVRWKSLKYWKYLLIIIQIEGIVE